MSQTFSTEEIKGDVKNYWNERSRTFDRDIGHEVDENERKIGKIHH